MSAPAPTSNTFNIGESKAPSALELRVRAMGENALRKPKPHENKEGMSTESTGYELLLESFFEHGVKNDRDTMEIPVFSLSKKPDLKPLIWTNASGTTLVQVEPSSIGRATIHDKDIVIFLLTKLMERQNNAMPLPSRVRAIRHYDQRVFTDCAG